MSYREEWFPQVYNDRKCAIDKDFETYKKEGLPENPINLYSFTSMDLATIAVGRYAVDKDISGMKNDYYNAAIAKEKAIRYFDAHPEKKYAGKASMLALTGLEYAIMSNSKALQIRYATLLGGRGTAIDRASTDKHTCNWGYALKYTVLGDDVQAMAYVEKLTDKSRQQLTYCLKAILERNEEEVNRWLLETIKKRKRSKIEKETQGEILCMIAIVLAKLALMRGITVTIDDLIAPKELIELEEVDYHLVDIVTLFTK